MLSKLYDLAFYSFAGFGFGVVSCYMFCFVKKLFCFVKRLLKLPSTVQFLSNRVSYLEQDFDAVIIHPKKKK